MLQFAGSTVFLTRSITQKKLLSQKYMASKNLPKCGSVKNLKENSQEQNRKNRIPTQNISKKSLKQKLFKKQVDQQNTQKKSLQNIESKNLLQAKKISSHSKGRIIFNPIHTQNTEQQKKMDSFSKSPQKQKQESNLLFKKRLYRNTNHTAGKKESNSIGNKSASFLGKNKSSFFISKSKDENLNGRNIQSRETCQYYVEDLKKEIRNIDMSYEENGLTLPIIVGHFFQSISTFFRFKNIQQPDQSHISIFLPKHKRCKTTLIFDMDETLIHAQPYQNEVHSISWGQNFEICIDDGSKIMINLKVRPFALQVLQRLKSKYEIGIFTAANENYAKQIINKIDPSGKIFDFTLYRQHCHIVDGKLAIKDLRILANRSLRNTILIDNSPHTYLYQSQNAIPIISFYNDLLDQQFLKLQNLLLALRFQKAEDVRPALKKKFQFHRYTEFQNIEELIEELYGGEMI